MVINSEYVGEKWDCLFYLVYGKFRMVRIKVLNLFYL